MNIKDEIEQRLDKCFPNLEAKCWYGSLGSECKQELKDFVKAEVVKARIDENKRYDKPTQDKYVYFSPETFAIRITQLEQLQSKGGLDGKNKV